MRPPDTANWIRSELLALPLYGVLTFWSSFDPQPDPNTDYEAWSRYVTTNHYVLTHRFGSTLGLILAVFGAFALGAHLAKSRAGRLALVAMVITATGSALFPAGMGVSTFAAPEEGQAYLAGIEGLPEMPTSFADIAFAATSVLVVVLFFGVSFVRWPVLHDPPALLADGSPPVYNPRKHPVSPFTPRSGPKGPKGAGF